MNVARSTMRRFQTHKPPLVGIKALAADHPAALAGRTLYEARRQWAGFEGRVLKDGHNSRKIGRFVTKGRWRGMPIFTLTLEERATCPRSCDHWLDCYGNKMNWSNRLLPGDALERRLDAELSQLQRVFPGGFVVRLHVLGDFYSVGYVDRWAGWLDQHPALRVFGYSARPAGDAIGDRLRQLVAQRWDRFAVRFSGAGGEGSANTIRRMPDAPRVPDGIVCPAQTGRTECCGTCGLCWGTRAPVAFVVH